MANTEARARAGDSKSGAHRLTLPDAPESELGRVKAWQEPVAIFSFLPGKPDPNPMFLEKRVYQGSSGRVYPLAFIDRIATEGQEHSWQAVHLENEYLRVMVLPEIGGRIHIGLDKLNGYDFFYRQNVIKPALVGLAGPWISGGVEFNWPQHHRPATFMPVEVEIEREDDGSITVWCSDHDPMSRMKGMHGVCLRPGSACIEVKVRLYNRTPSEQTFLWWANAAVRVHEQYRSFFPADVDYVADHAKRAISRFPLAEGTYYGVDYAERARSGVPEEERPRLFEPDGSYAANDLSWYSNIPVPTSYMVTGTEEDFFGGYDHSANAGMVHVANRHIAPGKKQWTWGNHEFGYAWDRNLTESDGPYIELMAGVYTDNQPDFSFLAPGETKAFSQFWYPIRQIGVPQAANVDAALSFQLDGRAVRIAVAVTHNFSLGSVEIRNGGKLLASFHGPLEVATPIELRCKLAAGVAPSDLTALVVADGRKILAYTPRNPAAELGPAIAAATELPLPEDISTNEELYLAGLHLQQYRHATRRPEIYWQEALRRDEGDSNAHRALGIWRLNRGECGLAEYHLRRAIDRLTKLNPNPQNGESFYALGQALRAQRRDDEAYAAFYKASWSFGVRSAAYHALAEIDASRHDWKTALTHVRLSLSLNRENLNARNLAAIALSQLGRNNESQLLLAETRQLDRLDIWSRYLENGNAPGDNQRRLDLALSYARLSMWTQAVAVLQEAEGAILDGSGPMVAYTLGWLYLRSGDEREAARCLQKAANAPPDYCFPSRIEEIEILETAIALNPQDPRAPYYLGNLLYDRRRHAEAIVLWELSAQLDPAFPTAWRNLGFAYFNIEAKPEKAREAFDRALAAGPDDARVLYERDQLWKRIGEAPETRLSELERHPHLLATRDDLAAELATLYNRLGKLEQALELLSQRRFQPWEGGEGLVLGQWARTNLLLGQRALLEEDALGAMAYFQAAITPPENLGEAKHLLANESEAFYWIGVASFALNRTSDAEIWWRKASRQNGDFQNMRVQAISDKTYWGARSLAALGCRSEALQLFRAIEQYSRELERQDAGIDYFATSLPNMLLFEEDLSRRNLITATFLRGQSCLGLNLVEEAAGLLRETLNLDVNHAAAADLLRSIAQELNSPDRSESCTPSLQSR
jgi:tetratricopeptide (TPR) repeat protein